MCLIKERKRWFGLHLDRSTGFSFFIFSFFFFFSCTIERPIRSPTINFDDHFEFSAISGRLNVESVLRKGNVINNYLSVNVSNF